MFNFEIIIHVVTYIHKKECILQQQQQLYWVPNQELCKHRIWKKNKMTPVKFTSPSLSVSWWFAFGSTASRDFFWLHVSQLHGCISEIKTF